MDEEGYCEEELKMRNESRKMLHDDDLRVHASCVRVPVLRTHAEAVNVSFNAPCSVGRSLRAFTGCSGRECAFRSSGKSLANANRRLR